MYDPLFLLFFIPAQQQCNCPSISCPKVTQIVTAKPISCVSQTPVTPCPTVKKDITSQSTTDSSGSSTKDPLAQHQDPNGGNSSGISGGKYQQWHNQFRYD